MNLEVSIGRIDERSFFNGNLLGTTFVGTTISLPNISGRFPAFGNRLVVMLTSGVIIFYTLNPAVTLYFHGFVV